MTFDIQNGHTSSVKYGVISQFLFFRRFFYSNFVGINEKSEGTGSRLKSLRCNLDIDQRHEHPREILLYQVRQNSRRVINLWFDFDTM